MVSFFVFGKYSLLRSPQPSVHEKEPIAQWKPFGEELRGPIAMTRIGDDGLQRSAEELDEPKIDQKNWRWEPAQMSVTAAFSGGGGRELSLNLHLLISASSSSLQQPPEGVALHRCSEVRLLLPPSPRIRLATSHLLLDFIQPLRSALLLSLHQKPPRPPPYVHIVTSFIALKGIAKERRKLVNEECKGPAVLSPLPAPPPSFAFWWCCCNTGFQTSTVCFRFYIQTSILGKSIDFQDDQPQMFCSFTEVAP